MLAPTKPQLLSALRMVFREMMPVLADLALPTELRMRAWRIVTRISALDPELAR